MRYTYESDDQSFPADAYRIKGDKYAVSWYVRGWQTEPIEPEAYEVDGQWFYPENDEPEYERTGRVVCTMIGDDGQHLYDPEDLIPLDEKDYCHVCGQIGCSHDGIDRSGEDE